MTMGRLTALATTGHPPSPLFLSGFLPWCLSLMPHLTALAPATQISGTDLKMHLAPSSALGDFGKPDLFILSPASPPGALVRTEKAAPSSGGCSPCQRTLLGERNTGWISAALVLLPLCMMQPIRPNVATSHGPHPGCGPLPVSSGWSQPTRLGSRTVPGMSMGLCSDHPRYGHS